jgi:hypothetical protein
VYLLVESILVKSNRWFSYAHYLDGNSKQCLRQIVYDIVIPDMELIAIPDLMMMMMMIMMEKMLYSSEKVMLMVMLMMEFHQ